MKSPQALVVGITALALALAEGCDNDELDILSVAFSQLGDTLATIALQRAKLEKRLANKNE